MDSKLSTLKALIEEYEKDISIKHIGFLVNGKKELEVVNNELQTSTQTDKKLRMKI